MSDEPTGRGPQDDVVDDDASDAGPVEAARETPVAVERPRDRGDAELLTLIDHLATMLERSDLSELAIGSGATELVLRKPTAVASTVVVTGGGEDAGGGASRAPATGSAGAGGAASSEAPSRPSVKAPLTGIFYASPAPGSAPYVQAGGEVAVGQVIGLIEAMKLFNEIKSDLAGRVVRVIPESGTLVKAKQPLLEVEPL